MANFVNIPLGLKITTQIPLNVKEFAGNQTLLKDLGVNDNLAFTYFKRLRITCLDDGTQWEWREVEIGEENTGLLDVDFIYPPDWIVFGIDYSNKLYNFFSTSVVFPGDQDLQSVLDTGNTYSTDSGTTSITFGSGDEYNRESYIGHSNNETEIALIEKTAIGVKNIGGRIENFSLGKYAQVEVQNGKINLLENDGNGNQTSIKFLDPAISSEIFFPAKTTGSGTYILATLDDIIDVSDATVSVKGILKLTGDLGGTADSPTTPTAIHKNGNEVGLTGNKAWTNGAGKQFSILDTQGSFSAYAIGASSYPAGYLVTDGGHNNLELVQSAGAIGNFIKAVNPSAVTVFSVNNLGDTRSNSFIKTGGLSTQFLKADGSVSLAAQSDTGVLTFAGLTANSTTTINIGAVTGYVVDNETNPLLPTYIAVNYAGEINKTVTTLAGTETFVMLTSAGTITFQNTYPTSTERKSKIWLGKISHPSGSITVVINEPDYITSPTAFVRDLYQKLVYINEGVYPYANGSNLNFNLTGGVIGGNGINFVTDRTNPNNLIVNPTVISSFIYRTRIGGFTGAVTVIDPTRYDVAGTPTLIGGSVNNATIQYFYLVPGQGVIVQYGQTIYPSLSAAITAVGKESLVIYPNLVKNSILIGVLAVNRQATQLNNPVEAQFFKADMFGQIIGATSGTAVGTLQTAYNNSPIPQIQVTDSLGAVTIKNNRILDTSSIQEWQNIAGTGVAKITGNGDITTNSFIKLGGTSTQQLMADGTVKDINPQKATVVTSNYTLTDTDHGTTIFVDTTGSVVIVSLGSITIPNYCVGFIHKAGLNDLSYTGVTNPIGLKSLGIGYQTFIERELATANYYLLGNTKI